MLLQQLISWVLFSFRWFFDTFIYVCDRFLIIHILETYFFWSHLNTFFSINTVLIIAFVVFLICNKLVLTRATYLMDMKGSLKQGNSPVARPLKIITLPLVSVALHYQWLPKEQQGTMGPFPIYKWILTSHVLGSPCKGKYRSIFPYRRE